MGSFDERDGGLRGVLIPDSRATFASLTDKGAGTTGSAYTQAGPRTGPAEGQQASAMVLATSGEQSEDGEITFYTQRAGHPGLEAGGFLFKRATGDYFGWDGPQLLSGWLALAYTGVAVGYEIWPEIVRLQSGRTLMAFNTSTLGVIQIDRYDPSDATTTAANLTPSGNGAAYVPRCCTMVQLPNERVLAFITAFAADQVDVYYSDDEGTTWTLGGYRVLDVAVPDVNVLTMRAGLNAGEVLLLVGYNDGAYKVRQYASGAMGTSFTDIGDAPGGQAPQWPGIAPIEGGGFVVVWRDGTQCRFTRIGTAFTALSGATWATVGGLSTAGDGVCIAKDEDGLLYILTEEATAVRLRRSDDGGASWDLYSSPIYDRVASDSLRPFQLGFTQGRGFLVTRWAASVATQDSQSVGMISLGGHATHTAPGGANQGVFTDTAYMSFADDGRADYDTALDGGVWIPIELPGDNAWTTTGSGTIALSGGMAAIDTSSNTVINTRDLTAGTASLILAAFVEVELQVDSGDGDDGTDRIALKVRLTDRQGGAGSSTYDFEVGLRFDDAGYTLYDYNAAAAIGSSATKTITSLVRIRLMIDKAGNVRTWHCTQAHSTVWTEGPEGSAQDDGATSNDRRVQWGHLAGTAVDGSDWNWLGYCFWAGRWTGAHTGEAAASWTTPDDLHPRSYPTRPALVDDGVRLAAADGPSFVGETWITKPSYEYPISNIFPEINTSPNVTYRGTADNIEVLIPLDLTGMAGGRLLNHAVGIGLLNTNLREAVLEYGDGATWTTMVTMAPSTNYGTLPFTRSGDVVYVDTGTAGSSAWLPYGAAIGATFQLSASVFRKVVEHSEGAWEDGTTKRPWFRLADVVAGDPASGTGALFMPNFVGIVHEHDAAGRYLRLRIPAHVTADGYYEIGQMPLGHLALFGHHYSHAHQLQRSASVTGATWGNGQRRTRKTAPTRRRWSFAWAEGVDGWPLAGTAPSPDYAAATSGGLPLAALADGPRLMEGLVADRDGSNEPVLFLPSIPTATGTITDPDLILWGRMDDEFSRDNVQGDEGNGEVVRSSQITITEEL